MKKIILTSHCIKRLDERVHVSKNAAKKIIREAYNNGFRESYFVGKKKEYLARRSSSDYFATFYKGWIYIFALNGCCITLFSAPHIFYSRKRNYIRNYYKYFKYNLLNSKYNNMDIVQSYE